MCHLPWPTQEGTHQSDDVEQHAHALIGYGSIVFSLLVKARIKKDGCVSLSEWVLIEHVQVRGLPCAHNFHVECIDEWLRLNVKCPHCRYSVFPNLDLSTLSNLHTDTGRPSASLLMTTCYVHAHPVGQSYLLRLQGLLRTIRMENASGGNDENGLEAAEDGRAVLSQGPPSTTAPVMMGTTMTLYYLWNLMLCNNLIELNFK
ncbi:E3 ubiquitin-protein ligase SIS3-like [Magnolia sinica]|uniref:E3 ubiquitin-protein ligase SIS3-like n=1 Tax=Magnolia sinica TaxID=86752 RepID=UPI002658369A|nr:E3 ubiquitin-protein ligase SIS3-like [Magnolia sinica]